jgi:hypothetical protein
MPLTTERPTAPSDAPPRVASGAGRRLAVIGAGLVFGAALLVVLFNMNTGEPPPVRPPVEPGEVRDLLDDMTGLPLDDLDVDDEGDIRDQPDISLADGFWIRQYDEDGRLAQMYGAERTDPRPGNIMDMVRPRVVLFMSDGRVVTLRGDAGTVIHSADKRLISGRMTGRVRMRLFEPGEGSGAAVNIDADHPRVIVDAAEAEFDESRGEIRCADVVDVQTDTVEFHGLGLTALYNEASGLSYLVVERQTEPMRIASIAFENARPSPPRDTPALPEAESDEARSADGGNEAASVEAQAAEPEAVPPPASREPTNEPASDPAQEAHTTERGTSGASGASPSSERDAAAAERGAAPGRTAPARSAGEGRDRSSAPARRIAEGPPAPDWLERRRADAESRARRRAETGEVAPPPSGTIDPTQPRFYRAVFHDVVRISRYDDTQTVEADELRIVFSMENSGLGDALAFGRPSFAPAVGLPFDRLYPALVAMALSAFGQDPSADDLGGSIVVPAGPDDIYLTYQGRLIVTPLAPGEVHLAGADAVHVQLVGAPVRITDVTRDLSATCGQVDYLTSEETLVLAATPAAGLHLASPDANASGERLEYGVAAGTANFHGPGTMHLAQRDTEGGEEHRQVSGIDIEWRDGVALAFDERAEGGAAAALRDEERTSDSPSGRLREATFFGDVIVNEDRFNLATRALRVSFDEPAADGSENLRDIEADGDVRVRGLDERGGLLVANHLLIQFEPPPDRPNDRRQPRMIYATGNARAEDPTQSIEADAIEVRLVEAAPKVDERGGETPTEPGTMVASDARFDDMEIEHLTAVDNVVVVLPNGTRASGDLLVADARAEQADLTGESVTIEGSEQDVQFTAAGTHVHMERVDGESRLSLEGPGATSFPDVKRDSVRVAGAGGGAGSDAVADPAEPEPSGTPPANDTVDIDVEWTQRLVYRARGEDDPGVVDIYGDVKALSIAPTEDNSIACQRLTLLFGEEPDPADPSASPRRSLRHLTARGDAVLESKVWATADRANEPRWVHITGGQVEYDQRQLEAEVIGPGTMLIVDPRPAETGGGDAPASTRSLTGRGATVFEWTGGMTMTELVDERYNVVMDREVGMRHQAIDGSTATLACAHLDVTMTRRAMEERAGGLDFGGSTDIERFIAQRGVRLDAAGKQIDCSILTFDQRTQIAEILGSESLDASILVEGAVAPTRASRFIWDLRTDRVQVTGARGSIPRGR